MNYLYLGTLKPTSDDREILVTSWEVVIEVIMSVVLKTDITLMRTVLKICDNLYSLQS